jgi:thiol-disulfide isomerase/thioredoxin
VAIPIIHFTPDFPSVNRQDAKRQTHGKFSLRYDRTDIEHGLQIEAPGYRTWRTSQRYKMGDTSPTLDIRLQPTTPHVGRVLDSAGQPVSDAAVYVATAYQHLDVFDLKNRGGDFHSNYYVATDADGGFEIIGQMERYALVVIASQGFAQVERQAEELPGELRIQPWAKVSGELVEAGEPVKGCTVHLFPIRPRGADDPRVDIRFSETTAGDGSFTFERVPPLLSQVHGFLHFSVDSPLMSSRNMPLALLPGEDRRVVLGGGGAQITGKLLVENQPAGFDYHFSISYLVAKRPGIEPPAAIASAGFDWRKGWTDAWRNSSEGGTYLNTLHTWFVKPNADGRFRVSGVEPGEYELAVNLFGTTEGCLLHPLATRVIPLTVNPNDKSLDLGRLSIPSLTLPKVGDMAPDFEFTTLDGNSGRLSGLRGRYVLLDFWATWCGPCVAKLGDVERLRERFAAEKRLEVVGLNLDAERSRVDSFLRSTRLPWTHVPLGDWSATTIPRQFAISGIPAYVLIDHSGRIAAQENSLEKIEAALREK